ncbi:MAG: phage holin family protein [Synergistaceae bacterium]|nr:phage holin family protein [Synergistaceae bacterium]
MNDELSEFFIAGFVGILGWFFGGLDGYTKVLIAFAVIDYITGICRAGAEGVISSQVGFKGIARKIIMFILVGVANITEQHLLGNAAGFKTVVTLFYIGNEGISIVENADALGVPIPKFLRGKFLSFTKQNKNKDKKRCQKINRRRKN